MFGLIALVCRIVNSARSRSGQLSKTLRVGIAFQSYDVKLTVMIVYGFALIQLLTTLPSGGLGAFANIIIKVHMI